NFYQLPEPRLAAEISAAATVPISRASRPPLETARALKGGGSSDGQVGDEHRALCLRAQQHSDKEDNQADDRCNQDRTRKADLVEGRVPNQERRDQPTPNRSLMKAEGDRRGA